MYLFTTYMDKFVVQKEGETSKKFTFLADMSAKALSPNMSKNVIFFSSRSKVHVFEARKAWNGWFCNKKISSCEVKILHISQEITRNLLQVLADTLTK